MSSAGPTTTDPREQETLRRAQEGDEAAFARLTERYRGELHAHCYRMLGSVHDAEDALQDAMLRAWKALPRFEGRSSFRSWLYTIATNTSLDLIGRRKRRVLPVDYAPSDPHEGPGEPILESVWIEPYADREFQIEDGLAGPEARYEQREAVELAFVAALQHLPPNQRAVLILREVLGFSAAEVAEALDTTTASVNSALQRARKATDEKLPEQSQQETLRSLGDDRVRELVTEYMEAWEKQDVDKVVSMLAEDAAFTMPPLRTWFAGREGIEVFLRLSPLSGDWRWKALPVQSNGQQALAFYAWDPGEERYSRFALNVLTFRGEEIAEVDAFIARTPETPDRETVFRMPEQPIDPDAMDAAFERLGLPESLAGDGSSA